MEKLTLEELKPILKDKWLDYYEANQWAIDKFITKFNHSRSHQYHSVNAEFVLCTMTIVEPRLKEFLSVFFLVCNDHHKIMVALGLSFDPVRELKERKKQRGVQEQNECCHQ